MTTRVLIVNESRDREIMVDTMGVDRTASPQQEPTVCKITRVGAGQHADFYVYDSQYLVIREGPG